MKAIVCLDDNEGMTFAGRRQSRDRVVCADILFLTRGKKLFMNAYSRKILTKMRIISSFAKIFSRKRARTTFAL